MRLERLTEREYRQQIAETKRILTQEMLREPCERDATFISECLETLEVLNKGLGQLQSGNEYELISSQSREGSKQTKFNLANRFKNFYSGSSKLAKVGIFVVFMVATLSVMATITQAVGIRVWSAIVHWDANYLQFNYGGFGDENPPIDETEDNVPHPEIIISENKAESIEFSSFDDLNGYLDDSFISYLKTMGFEFESARARISESHCDIRADFIRDEESIRIILYDFNDYDEAHYTQSVSFYGEYDECYTEYINGCECFIGKGKANNIISFSTDDRICHLISNADYDILESAAATLLQN